MEEKIDVEIKELQATLANIEEARPFEELTVFDVGDAHPRLVQVMETMMKKGKFTVPGEFLCSSKSCRSHSILYRLRREIRRPQCPLIIAHVVA
jgi:F-type H+-transporting ATPase subunit d